jgi:1-acyl-sn-glycerol-3-phosphate acyltransferase
MTWINGGQLSASSDGRSGALFRLVLPIKSDHWDASRRSDVAIDRHCPGPSAAPRRPDALARALAERDRHAVEKVPRRNLPTRHCRDADGADAALPAPVIRLTDESGLSGATEGRAAMQSAASPMTMASAPPGTLSARAILASPLPDLAPIDRVLVRGLALVGCRRIRCLDGLEHIAPDRDPFILALNHSTRQEAILVPALLFLVRRGRRIHFLADWNFRLLPGIDLLYGRAGAITVARKPARPRLLDLARPLFADAVSPMEQARRHLLAGCSIGIFPEGTVNRDPLRLLRGRHGAARLSLETGAPVVPVGLRTLPGQAAIAAGSTMGVTVGPPLRIPSAPTRPASYANVRAWHARIMTNIGALAGKQWEIGAQEAGDENS